MVFLTLDFFFFFSLHSEVWINYCLLDHIRITVMSRSNGECEDSN